MARCFLVGMFENHHRNSPVRWIAMKKFIHLLLQEIRPRAGHHDTVPQPSAKPQHLVSTSVVGIADFKLHTPQVADSLGVRGWNWGNWWLEAFLDCLVISPDGL
ncbi:unnamed protein product [Clonostachys rosea f. rosea IK726]|uniref:Uncharacterized protein n=2 Tax=Bionectria ochroleuca TaxID=29856 RepID=A0A0B7JYB0_BIOOC|nr:unnamed protein product [Clonostachys rosea f. rosea IK726]